MPQYQCLKCCSCHTFQAKQVTKNPQFSCLRCGTKQTVQHVYAISDHPKDIRLHVQELNMARGTAEEQKLEKQLMAYDQDAVGQGQDGDDNGYSLGQDQDLALHHQPQRTVAVWNQYITEEQEKEEQMDEPDEDPKFVTTIQDKAARRVGKGGRGGHGEGPGSRPKHARDAFDVGQDMSKSKGGFGCSQGLGGQHQQHQGLQQAPRGIVRSRNGMQQYDIALQGRYVKTMPGGMQSDGDSHIDERPAKHQAIADRAQYTHGSLSHAQQPSDAQPRHASERYIMQTCQYGSHHAVQGVLTQPSPGPALVQGPASSSWPSQMQTQVHHAGFQTQAQPNTYQQDATKKQGAAQGQGRWPQPSTNSKLAPARQATAHQSSGGRGPYNAGNQAALAQSSMWGNYLVDDDVENGHAWDQQGCDDAGFVTAL